MKPDLSLIRSIAASLNIPCGMRTGYVEFSREGEGSFHLVAYLRVNEFGRTIEVANVSLHDAEGAVRTEGPHRTGLFRDFMKKVARVAAEHSFGVKVENVLNPTLGPRLLRAGFVAQTVDDVTFSYHIPAPSLPA